MKAQATNPAQSVTASKERFRTGLILGGIVVAIIVSIFLSHDVHGQIIIPSVIPHSTSLLIKTAEDQPAGIGIQVLVNIIERVF